MPPSKEHQDAQASLAEALADLRNESAGPLGRPSRELSLAITNLEQAIHWHEAVKA